MIKRELAKDPKLANQSWDRFLPKLPKKSLSKRWKPRVIHDKKNKPIFPPPPQPRKIDLQMESGEYFLKGWEKKVKEKESKEIARQEKKREREDERKKDFIPPKEEIPKKKKRKVEEEGANEVKRKKKRSHDDSQEQVSKKKKRRDQVSEVTNGERKTAAIA